MADPFAPPSDRPRRRRPNPADEPESEPRVVPTSHQASYPEARDRPLNSEPASPGPFWLVAAIGIGVICLGRLVMLFTLLGDLDGELVAPALFGTLGGITLAIGLALAAVLQRGLPMGIRTALLLGGGYFAIAGDGLSLFSALGRFF